MNNITGKSCKYRHALPPGFVLKSKAQKKSEEEAANQITLEEFLETEVSYDYIKSFICDRYLSNYNSLTRREAP